MTHSRAMLSFDEALGRILALASGAPALEGVPLDLADGRVLAEDVRAERDVPAFDYSAMDGYAVRAGEVVEGAALPVRGESRTGAWPDALAVGTTMRIFTGAPMPAGADAVVMQERVTRAADVATFEAEARAGQHVRRRGEDLARGTVALTPGTRLGPGHLGLAASLDRAELRVFAKPAVTVLATGDELRPPGSPDRPGSVPESNSVAIAAMARRAGATARVVTHAADDLGATTRAVEEALAASDVLVTIGGVSVGDHDVVRPALEAAGVTIELYKVAIKPGKPLAVGRVARPGARDRLVLGLPGNPASAMVTFAVFGVPLLRALTGDRAPVPARARARLTAPLAHSPGRLELARVRAEFDRGVLVATPFGNQASGASTSMAAATALAFVPAESEGLQAGDEVDVVFLADLSA